MQVHDKNEILSSTNKNKHARTTKTARRAKKKTPRWWHLSMAKLKTGKQLEKGRRTYLSDNPTQWSANPICTMDNALFRPRARGEGLPRYLCEPTGRNFSPTPRSPTSFDLP